MDASPVPDELSQLPARPRIAFKAGAALVFVLAVTHVSNQAFTLALPLTVPTVVATAVLVLLSVHSVRARHRHQMHDLLVERLAPLLGARRPSRSLVKISRWGTAFRSAPVEFSLEVAPRVDVADVKWRTQVQQAIRSVLPDGKVQLAQGARAGVVKVLHSAAGDESSEPESEAAVRLKSIATDVLGDSAQLELSGDPEQPDEFTIKHEQGSKMAFASKRMAVERIVKTRVPGLGTPAWDLVNDVVTFKRKRPLPTMVVPPKEHAPLMIDHDGYSRFRVPLGVGDAHEQAFWKPKAHAHLLIIGGTGSGKTIAEHGVIQRLAQAGWRVWLVDGKQTEFMGYDDYPNVEFLAQDVDQQIRLLSLAHETMKDRYRLIRERKTKIADLDPIVIVIDELTSLFDFVKERYNETKVKGMPARHPVAGWVANIGRLGRTAKIHLVVGLQRPDAEIMGGELRDNFGARLSVGRLKSKEASIMMWDDPAIGVSVPDVKGRGICHFNGSLGQIQVTYSPNPEPETDDHHPQMLEALLPAVSAYTRKHIADPVPGLDEDEQVLTWNDLLEADIRSEEGRVIRFDPVASAESRALREERDRTPATENSETLQTAESFTAALQLFGDSPVEDGDSSEEDLPLAPAGIEGAGSTWGEVAPQLGPGALVEAQHVVEGQVAIVEGYADEFMVSTSAPAADDPTQTHLSGYTADGEHVDLVVPAETNVEVFASESLEDATA